MLSEKQIEVAAREYCRLMDLDPDEIISGAHEKHPSLCVRQSRWRWVAKQVRHQDAMRAVFAQTFKQETP